jgi:hypothetical protein
MPFIHLYLFLSFQGLYCLFLLILFQSITTLFQQPSTSNKPQVKNLHEVRMIRKGKSKYQGTLESVDSSCDITISYQTIYYKNQTVST